MTKRETAIIASSDFSENDKLYVQRARQALPFLVRQAKAGKPIYYSDLADEINIPNARNLNYILGSIGNTLIHLGKKEGVEIPPLQSLVINKRDELPGAGISGFIKLADFSKLSKAQKHKVIAAQLTIIYAFPYWDWVLKKLAIEPIRIDIDKELEYAKNFGGGGESEHHKNFKLFVSKNPNVVGLGIKLLNGIIEYGLPSADKIDVLFMDGKTMIGVEVKTNISNSADILRGLFQCIKYKALIEAEQIVKDEIPNFKVLLVLEGPLPENLILVKNILGIEVVENVKFME